MMASQSDWVSFSTFNAAPDILPCFTFMEDPEVKMTQKHLHKGKTDMSMNVTITLVSSSSPVLFQQQ